MGFFIFIQQMIVVTSATSVFCAKAKQVAIADKDNLLIKLKSTIMFKVKPI
ncbi:hypothetical protein [Lysinibacillus sphaericus]|uniref:hypothetical protein n=1 Tax=Lysinibacillus sphaericus TaxID=1421 RepID=UPI00163C4E51|nr:hypothetical protein [Lysinibacillus sp. SDF0037]